MKKILFLGLIVSLAISPGCKKNPLLVYFTLSNTDTFTIPPNSVLSLPPIFTPPFSTNSWQNQYTNNNTDKNHITSFKLNSLSLTAISPSGQTLGFVKSIEIYLEAPNLPNIEIAYIENNPTTAGSTINLTPVNVDLSSYAKADNFTLSINTTTQENNSNNVEVVANMTFNVVANPL